MNPSRALRGPYHHRPGLALALTLGWAALATGRFSAAAHDVIINEVMYHPASEVTLEEWVELHNRGTNAVDVTGWRFTRGVRYTFPPAVIPPGGYLVVAADYGLFTALHPSVQNVVGDWEGVLSNKGEAIQVETAGGEVVDSVRYADGGDWAARVRGPVDGSHRGWVWSVDHDGGGTSAELRNPNLSNQHGQNWVPSFSPYGTPGEVNAVLEGNIPPMILSVANFPEVPRSVVPVTVSCRILDEAPPGPGFLAQLYYRVDATPANPWLSVPMYDDGQHNDGLPLDGTFAGTIPPQADDVVVEYYVWARDPSGLVRTWPSPAIEADNSVGQFCNANYIVDDGVYTNTAPLYRVVLTQRERQFLDDVLANDPQSDAEAHATWLSHDASGIDQSHLASIRNRGHGSRTRTPHNFRVSFRGDAKWKGIEAINLNARYSYVQVLGAVLARKAGINNQQARPCSVRINTTDWSTTGIASLTYGLLAANEAPGNDFVDSHYPTDTANGNLYRGLRDVLPAVFDYRGADQDNYRPSYLKQNNQSEDDFSEVIELSRILSTTPDATYGTVVPQYVNVAQWMTYLGVMSFFDNSETSINRGYGDDYLIYFGVRDRRAELLGYDFDTVLGVGDLAGATNRTIFRPFQPTPGDPVFATIERFMKWPDFAPEYYAQLLRLIDGPFAPDQFNATVDQWLSGWPPVNVITNIKAFAAGRNAYIRSQIPRALTATAALESVDGWLVATNATLTLFGRGDAIGTRRVTVNGQTAAWVAWQARWTNSGIPLVPGTNLFLVQAFDTAGAELQRTNVAVWQATDGSAVPGTAPVLPSDTLVAPVAVIDGEPRPFTPRRQARLTVGGAGVTHYQWRLNDGDWSAEVPAFTPILLSNLPDGSHQVAVIGRDATGLWQPPAVPTLSRVWTVSGSAPRVVLNEFLAWNTNAVAYSNSYPDLIELLNDSDEVADLSGLRLTDDLAASNRFVFPPGTTLPPGGHLVVVANNPDGTPGFHVEFSLQQEGEGIYLLDRTNGVGVLDSVVFGLQLPDLSLGRVAGGEWTLCQPTLGSTNRPVALGDPAGLRINEWLAFGNLPPFREDYVELFNTNAAPVDLGGVFLTDEINGWPARHRIADHSFIAGYGYRVFKADGDTSAGADHLDFALAAEQGEVGLFNSNLALIDCVIYGPQRPGEAQGRRPDGSVTIGFLDRPTPGAANPPPPTSGGTAIATLVPFNATWRYNTAGLDLGAVWRTNTFNAAAWPAGGAVFGRWRVGLTPPFPVVTSNFVVNLGTYYYRTTFTNNVDGAILGLNMVHLIDDGAVVYLNGVECARYGMPNGAISFATPAVTVRDAAVQGPVALPVSLLRPGENVLAVEVHQNQPDSGDMIFAMQLDAVYSTNSSTAPPVVLNEFLADNRSSPDAGGSTPDAIELFNVSTNTVSLAGWSLTDDITIPRRWVFPAGATIAPRAFVVLRADGDLPPDTTNTGFGLNANGGTLYLFRDPDAGGQVADAITYGLQAADWSLGRVPDGAGAWTLGTPSVGGPNSATLLGDPGLLRLNEWMAAPEDSQDWFEVYNGDAMPVALGGLRLSDELANRTKHLIAAYSFISTGALAFVKFEADGDPQKGAHHVNFRLNVAGEALALSYNDGSPIDSIGYGPQESGVSEGRSPDGSGNFIRFRYAPTPAWSNGTDSDADGMPDDWETLHGLDPGLADDGLDLDGDGLTNLHEYFLGSDPADPLSRSSLSITVNAAGQSVVSFQAADGIGYTLQHRGEVDSGAWFNLIRFDPAPGPREISHTNGLADPMHFFRLKVR